MTTNPTVFGSLLGVGNVAQYYIFKIPPTTTNLVARLKILLFMDPSAL